MLPVNLLRDQPLSSDKHLEPMPHPERAIVTGAFSYTGGYIARKLLQQGVDVTTLTRHPDLHASFGGAVKSAPLDFLDTQALTNSMRGATVFFNTYWIRFERGQTTFDGAVENSKTLFNAAKKAGIERIVHISVSNPSPDSPLPYFKGKWQVEDELKKIRHPLRHHQTNPDFRPKRPPSEQHRLGTQTLSALPHLRQRRIPRPTNLRRRRLRYKQ